VAERNATENAQTAVRALKILSYRLLNFSRHVTPPPRLIRFGFAALNRRCMVREKPEKILQV